MEAVKHDIIDMKGKKVGTIDLDPAVFAAPLKKDLVHEVVKWQRNTKRAGTHSALNRAVMEGGGKKPWKQKGTGRARAGSSNSPVWVGGAVAHGPKPRKYGSRISKRAKRQALCGVLTDKRENGQLFILDNLEVASGKTKEFTEVLKSIGLAETTAIVITPEKQEQLWRASRNVGSVLALPVAGANVYDLVNRKAVVCTQAGLEALQARLLRQRQDTE